MGRVLDAEKPDLVVFTGDNLAGGMPDPELSIRRYSQPVVDRQIPWVHSGAGTRPWREPSFSVLLLLSSSLRVWQRGHGSAQCAALACTAFFSLIF